MSDKNQDNICGLCDKNISKYCCPRCEILYCSLECYKSERHSVCSESFYRECVNEELASHHADDESKRKMLDILKKMNDNEHDSDLKTFEDFDYEDIDSDDNDDCDLHERIKDIDLNDTDAVWDVLNEDEKNEFRALLSQGDVSSILPQWQPWWLYRDDDKLVQDVGENDSTMEKALKQCPELIEMPMLSSLTTKQPSPTIKFNIANVIAAYVIIMRYFNGEIDSLEFTTYFMNLCNTFDANINFEDFSTAVESVSQKCLQSELIFTDADSLNIMKQDVLMILKGPCNDNQLYYCKAVLSHLHKMFTEAKSTTKISKTDNASKKSEFTKQFPDHTKLHHLKQDGAKLKKCIKKIEYYLSYIESCGLKI